MTDTINDDIVDMAFDSIEEDIEPLKLEHETRRDWRRRLKTWQQDRKERKLQDERENNFSEEFIREIAEMIQQDNEVWCFMDTDLLMEFIRLAIRKYVRDEGGVKALKDGVADTEELKQKIKAAFDASPDSKKVNADQVMKLNAAYAQGKQLGSVPRKFIRKLLKKAT